jgi:DNA-binding transcriptional ArsR family regulator
MKITRLPWEYVFQELLEEPLYVIINVFAEPASFFPLLTAPLLTALYDPNNQAKQFFISLKDRRDVEEASTTWRVRWWAIPKTLDRPEVIARGKVSLPREFLLARLIMSPGITVRELASDLRVEPSVIQPELDRLREAGRIRVEGERLFLVSRVTP